MFKEKNWSQFFSSQPAQGWTWGNGRQQKTPGEMPVKKESCRGRQGTPEDLQPQPRTELVKVDLEEIKHNQNHLSFQLLEQASSPNPMAPST